MRRVIQVRKESPLHALIIVMLLWCIASQRSAFSQDLAGPTADSLPAISELRTPTSPAFTLLDVVPTSVDRPSTPSGLAIGLLNRTNSFSSLPENYAIEVAPYWLTSHPGLTWENDAERSIRQSIERTFSVSAATAELGTMDASVSGLAFGARALLMSGSLSDESRAELDSLVAELAEISELVRSLIEIRTVELQERFEAEMAGATSDAEREEIRTRYEKAFAAAEMSVLEDPIYVAARDAIEEVEVKRVGWFLDAAGGTSFVFPDQVWAEGDQYRSGVWATASYRGKTWNPVAVVRRIYEPDRPNFWDLGARLIYTVNDFGISAEGVYRYFSGEGAPAADYRLVGAVEYKISPAAWLIASFGRDYDVDAPGSLVAALGFTLNFSRQLVALSD